MRIIIVFISIFLCFINFSFAKSYKVGDKISDRIELYKKYTFELPEGDWTIADKFSYSYYGIISKGYTLLRIKNNKAIESFEIAELNINGQKINVSSSGSFTYTIFVPLTGINVSVEAFDIAGLTNKKNILLIRNEFEKSKKIITFSTLNPLNIKGKKK